MAEYKSLPTFIKDIDRKTRTVVGICSILGNVDDGDDRMWPGAFLKTISEGRRRVRHLWNHDFGSPPIATIPPDGLKEVGRDALPAQVLTYAPEATGGLQVERRYYTGVEMAEWVWTALDAGDVDEMSFGFDPVRYEWTVEGEGSAQRRIRELREVKLYDTSDVLWGMNDSTVAIAKGFLPLEAMARNLTALYQAIKAGKAGRRNAESDLQLINTIHDLTTSLGATTCMGIQADPTTEEDTAKTGQAGSGGDDAAIPLSTMRQALDRLKLAALTDYSAASN